MPDTNSFVDRIHYDGRREYTKHQGNIAYLDGAPLMRPADMPLAQRVIAIAIVAVAVIIGCVLVNKFVISKWQEATAAEQAVISNLAREASIETIPTVSGLINLNNEDIIASFEKSGYTLHDTTTPDDSGSMSLYKLPSDMSEDDAVPLLLHGIGSLEAQDASRFLVGSWYFGADRVGGTSMVVRYVDFSTGDPQIAVQNAVDKIAEKAPEINEKIHEVVEKVSERVINFAEAVEEDGQKDAESSFEDVVDAEVEIFEEKDEPKE